MLARSYGEKNPKMCIKLISHLGKSSGGAGLVGGQILDLYPKSKTLKDMSKMQFMKTGELIIPEKYFNSAKYNAWVWEHVGKISCISRSCKINFTIQLFS